jgi:hypothetical protein
VEKVTLLRDEVGARLAVEGTCTAEEDAGAEVISTLEVAATEEEAGGADVAGRVETEKIMLNRVAQSASDSPWVDLVWNQRANRVVYSRRCNSSLPLGNSTFLSYSNRPRLRSKSFHGIC